MRARIATLAALLSLAACDSTDDPSGLAEPLVVSQADFKSGALPGELAVAGAPPAIPAITSFTAGFGVLRPGTRGAQISGRSSKEAYSVGVRIKDQGTGYWVRPVGGEDPLIPNELSWSLAFDASSDIAPGKHDLEVVTFDESGKAGTKQTLSPLAIVSLRWNEDADLDLSLVAPDGTTYGRSKRSLFTNGKVIAKLSDDGVSGCLADGKRTESFSFLEVPPLGTWSVYVNLFDACAKTAVEFELTTYQRVGNPDGTFALEELSQQKVSGQLLRQQSNGGAGNATFVTEIKF
jgi:hypothetical protein